MSDTAVLRTPSQAYADGAAAGRWHDDPAQHPALRELDRIQRELLAATPTGLLARFGNRSGALPHTVILNAHRHSCAHHSGEINAHWLQQQLALCAAQKAPSR